jgi:sugar O-acyltransferase (sialic acid O-acetyltransferase NeuD family)
MKEVLILGGVGTGSIIAAAINECEDTDYKVTGYLSNRFAIGSRIEGIPVMGDYQQAKKFTEAGYYIINADYKIDNQPELIRNFKKLKIPESRLVTFVHPRAYIAKNVVLSPGVIVMANAAISSGSKIGKGTILMSGATVGNNSQISDYCFLDSQACLGAFVNIGEGAHIGLNSTIKESVVMKRMSSVAMGSVLLRDTSTLEIWAGNPAIMLRNINPNPEMI